ncbi:hypothetical protein D3C85_1202490 [compost metagenome]
MINIGDLDCLGGTQCRRIGTADEHVDLRILLQHVLGNLKAVVLQPVGGFAVDDFHLRRLRQHRVQAFGPGHFSRVAQRALEQADLSLATGQLDHLPGQLARRREVVGRDVGVALDVFREVVDADHWHALLPRQTHRHGRSGAASGGVKQHINAFAQHVLNLADLTCGIGLRISDQYVLDTEALGLFHHTIADHQVKHPLQARNRHPDGDVLCRFALCVYTG